MNFKDIDYPNDIKRADSADLPRIAEEIRDYMVSAVAETGGHLASSLGVVELTIALMRVFDFPGDKVVFDVGHQSYAYKLMTGRKDRFFSLRQMDGLSGFPKREESSYDSFNTGHSSTSISAALGMAVARDLRQEKHHVIAVIGDGALTGGMAYEAMNNAGSRDENLIVILNDNQMSISPNVGAMADYLARARTAPNYGRRKQHIKKILKRSVRGKKVLSRLRRFRNSIKYLMVQGMFFEEMGFTYLGPIDGHDIPSLEKTLGYAKKAEGPVLIHILTKKGKGYEFAEEEPDRFHGIAPFDKDTGKLLTQKKGKSFSSVFGERIAFMGETDERVVAITAAMPDGTGLNEFRRRFPSRYFDVGIAEGHAVTYAAGLAAAGMHPCVAVYSSFMQRAEDQIYHDVCLQEFPVVFALDRAGVVGEDGETHQGIYDISLLRAFPDMTLMSPGTEWELNEMLRYAFSLGHPVALRYPRGSVSAWDKDFKHEPVRYGKGELVKEGESVLLIPLGIMMEEAVKAAELLECHDIKAGIFNPRFVKPLDEEALMSLAGQYRYFITIEDHSLAGGFGSAVLEAMNRPGINIHIECFGYPDEIIRQGSRGEILKKYRLDAEGIAQRVLKLIKL